MAWGTFDDTQNVTPGPDDWDTVYFAGERCPGTAKVTVRLASELDERRQVEVKKSFVIDKGSKPVRVTIDLELQLSELADYYTQIIPLVAPRGKSTGQVPLAVSHPALLMYSLEMLMIESLEQSPPKPGGGTVAISISAIEYEPAPKKLKASKAKTADAAPVNDNPTNPKPSGDIDNLYK